MRTRPAATLHPTLLALHNRHHSPYTAVIRTDRAASLVPVNRQCEMVIVLPQQRRTDRLATGWSKWLERRSNAHPPRKRTHDPHPSCGGTARARTLAGTAGGMDELSEKVASHSPSWVQLNAHAHPFVERLIGTIRREHLDHTLFWTAADLEEKRRALQNYFDRYRVHSGLEGRLPEPGESAATLDFASYRWQILLRLCCCR